MVDRMMMMAQPPEKPPGSIPHDGLVTFCPTADLERAARFYEGTLGLPLILDQGKCRIYRVSRDGYLGFCASSEGHAAGGDADSPTAPTDRLILTLVSEDVEAAYARLVQAGVVMEKPLQHNPAFNITHCFFRDPDGRLIELQRFDDPAWPGRG
jgi:catechol 2,3-dioxygenase-like lactoylglutathione lyase family enzyme